MKRARALLLGLMVALLALANLPHAQAAGNPCIEQCAANYRSCYQSCNGSSSCISNCQHILTLCDETCET
jgi:hypothetical protein